MIPTAPFLATRPTRLVPLPIRNGYEPRPAVDDHIVRVLVAQRDGILRSGMRRALTAEAQIEIVGETGAGPEVVILAARTQPDAILLDADLHGDKTLTYLDRVRVRFERVAVIVFADQPTRGDLDVFFDRGAAGIIFSTIEFDAIAPAVRAIAAGARGQVFGRARLAIPRSDRLLTQREIDTLQAASRGLTNRAIARELAVTEHTVKFHLTSIYRKLNLRSRTEATHWAVENGFLQRAPSSFM